MKITAVLSCFALFVVAVLTSSSAAAGQDSEVVAHDAWVRVPAPSKMDTALYLVLENHTSTPRAVVSASSDAAAKVEMHEMKIVKKDDSMSKAAGSTDKSMGSSDSSMSMSMNEHSSQPMMTMTLVGRIVIPANGKVALAPNGLHFMIFGLKSRPAMGDKIKVTLKLDDGTTVPVVATVK